MTLPDHSTCKVAVIGLGYVGLPLAVEIEKPRACLRTSLPLRRQVIGFDVNNVRLEELNNNFDRTNELSRDALISTTSLQYTNNPELLSHCDVFIVTVPTPIDSAKRPDLTPLIKASGTVAHALQMRAIHRLSSKPVVIYESTVYPGTTEEICIPILEGESGLIHNKDFFCGYSPERVNPGDPGRNITTITKVTSGSNPEAASWIDLFYGSFISAGTHKAPSLKVAEAAKVIENTQRDLNIALVNELAIIFRKLHIDTRDVLDAASSKWNFLGFWPGLVGGHCIGVDPYYLTHKAQQVGYHPEVVLAGRRINDSMGSWVVEQLVIELARRRIVIGGCSVLVLGLSFKENCPDIRNTRVIDVVNSLTTYGIVPVLVDPWVNSIEAMDVYSLTVHKTPPQSVQYDAVIAAVAHHQFSKWTNEDWQSLIKPNGIFYDLKGSIPRELNPIRL